MTRLVIVKGWLGGVGLVVGLFGMAWQVPWAVWTAVGLLTVTFVLRFVKPRVAP